MFWEGAQCTQFKEMKTLILEEPHLDEKFELKKDNPLKSVEGILGEMSLERIPETNKDVIIRDGTEIFIPSKCRNQALEELYSIHLSSSSMKRLGRGKFYWPGFGRDKE